MPNYYTYGNVMAPEDYFSGQSPLRFADGGATSATVTGAAGTPPLSTGASATTPPLSTAAGDTGTDTGGIDWQKLIDDAKLKNEQATRTLPTYDLGRKQLTPTVDYATYGMGPEQKFFSYDTKYTPGAPEPTVTGALPNVTGSSGGGGSNAAAILGMLARTPWGQNLIKTGGAKLMDALGLGKTGLSALTADQLAKMPRNVLLDMGVDPKVLDSLDAQAAQATDTGPLTSGQQPTGTEKPPTWDPIKKVVVAGGTSAAAIAAAKALAASKGAVTVEALTGEILAGPGAAAGTGALGAAGGAGAAGGTGAAGGAGTGAAGTGLGSALKTAGQAAAFLIGAHQAIQGISQGKEGKAAANAALAAASVGGPVAAAAAAALAAIGASLVQDKEMGDVALRNYWKGIDSGRNIGESDPNELAQGFINFYRTNKNEFPGQAKYGRTGNEDFMYDMTQVINNAVEKGDVPKDADAATIYKSVVQPWLGSMGEGPKNEDARGVQDFMMVDLINNFMQGKPISNAQVKNDKKFKIVSQKPVYAGTPPGMTPPATTGGEGGLGQSRPNEPDQPFAIGGLAGGGEMTGGLIGYAGGGKPERYVEGPGSGRDDKIPALLSDGEYVIDAETLALLGDGSTKEGAKRMDSFRAKIRKHKGRALSRGRISPNAKSPEKYMGGGLS